MLPVTTCLWFNTEGEEAATFYVSLVPNSRITKVTHYTVETPSPNPVGSVLTVDFELNGQRFQALNGGPEFPFTEAASLVLACDDQEEADRLWETLGTGGEFGPCGWLKDRFGLSWQIYPSELDELFEDPDPQRAAAAMRTMLSQSRIDVSEIKSAMEAAVRT
ncbi:VOC family protein [Ornithinimicrobium cryptoxanthini]|uniref:VOC family protein n=1 Tax=Ornithinimicrobium cryptoxanthini TaxID=2934161 RepID=A0ABY4YM80_9MICO|nr:VOC family protein [Ornithinimicrobium cryptoxanthini]USQ77902.1 VOC family protein [Ornithinimicrobium cryptoxanthini]